jgi:hypothetical protein
MAFAGLNYLAIVIAAGVAWMAGGIWYTVLARPWVAALGITPEAMAEARKRPGAFLPFLYSLAADLVMAWVLAGLVGHLGAGQVTVRNGIISALFCWAGFVFAPMLVNYSFAMRSRMLLLIDAAHWLLVLVLMGAIIGAMGV